MNTKLNSAKVVLTASETERTVERVLAALDETVGSTLGPGGRCVLVQRPDGLPAQLTKDGVTVARAFGFQDGAEDEVLNLARDPAVQVANRAGDGTTTTVVLTHSLYRSVTEFCRANPAVGRTLVARRVADIVQRAAPTLLAEVAMAPKFGTPDEANVARRLLRAVARTSANGDAELADVVVRAVEAAGDHGNVTIAEEDGPSGVRYETVEGYALPTGYEASCRRMSLAFCNSEDEATVRLDRAGFLLWYGQVNRIEQVAPYLHAAVLAVNARHRCEADGKAWAGPPPVRQIVLVATAFSESVVTKLAKIFRADGEVQVFPLQVPEAGIQNYAKQLMLDLGAVTGAKVFDSTVSPDQFRYSDLGPGLPFEANRERSSVLGFARGRAWKLRQLPGKEPELVPSELTYDDLRAQRVRLVQDQIAKASGQKERVLTEQRMVTLSGGLARLVVSGLSGAETKERRDRAEDAVCAVRQAVQHGCLPAGGWGLAYLACCLRDDAEQEQLTGLDAQLAREVIFPALQAPLRRMLANAGLGPEPLAWGDLSLPPLEEVVRQMFGDKLASKSNCGAGFDPALGFDQVYDAAAHRWVDPLEAGLMDSLPAVLEAVLAAASVASVLSATSAAIVTQRDRLLEHRDFLEAQEWRRNAGINEANERP